MELTSTRVAGDQIRGHKSLEVTSPYDGRVVGRVPECGADEVALACGAAERLLDHSIPPQHERAHVLITAAERIRQRSAHHAHILSLETGKPIRDARAEVQRCVDTLSLCAAEARRLTGEMVPMDATASGQGRLGFALRVPVGVVGAITPFNFPLNLVAHKVGPAIAAGCPVVLKPASKTPLSAIELVEVLVASGLPGSFISVVTGRAAGDALVRHPVPKLLTFTGSAAVGRGIAATASDKKVRLELGSNAPLIIGPDADVEEVARLFGKAAFGFAGQSCISAQRVLCHASLRDRLREALVAVAEGIVMGDPLEESTELGPLIDPKENDRVSEWVHEAERAGGRLLTGGGTTRGIFRPTLLEDVPMGTRAWRDELFAPVACLRSYEDFDEAIAIANDTSQPLQAGLFTRDLKLALEAAKRLRFGGVLINDMPTYRADQQPYGGEGEAGNTREGPRYATEEMTTLRFVSLRA